MKKVLFIALICSSIFTRDIQAQVITEAADTTRKSNAGIEFETNEHNFGTVIEGQIASYEFAFKNNGTEPLKLNHVKASCGCTTPSWPREKVGPGETAVIKAEYNSAGRPGSFHKNIFVKSNGGDVTLTIKGNVVKEPDKPSSPIIIK